MNLGKQRGLGKPFSAIGKCLLTIGIAVALMAVLVALSQFMTAPATALAQAQATPTGSTTPDTTSTVAASPTDSMTPDTTSTAAASPTDSETPDTTSTAAASPTDSMTPGSTATAAATPTAGTTPGATTTAAASPTAGTTSGMTSTLSMSMTELYNQRADLNTTIDSSNVSQLRLAWRVPVTGMVSHMPLTDDNGQLYFADWDGNVYAVDAQSGEVIWQKQVEQNVQSDWAWHGFAGTGALGNGVLYEASVEGNVYAIDTQTGDILWQTNIANSQYAGNIGKPLYYDGVLYLGLSSVEEPLSKDNEDFQVSFHGAVMALDGQTGDVLWNQPLVESPNNGVAVWSSFALDPQKSALYFATGNNYTGTASELSDSMVAVDTTSGQLLWHYQVTPNDVWLPDHAVGPDYDFGAGPQLFDVQRNGQARHLIGAGQKSGFYSVFDRDTGEHVWSTFIGYATVEGGIRGEASYADGKIYVWSNNSFEEEESPTDQPITVKALDAATGKTIWFKDKAQPAVAASAGYLANDVYFVGSADGTIQGYDTSNGDVLWTAKTPSAVGSSLLVANDMLYAGIGIPKDYSGQEPVGNGVYAFSLNGTAVLTGSNNITYTAGGSSTSGSSDTASSSDTSSSSTSSDTSSSSDSSDTSGSSTITGTTGMTDTTGTSGTSSTSGNSSPSDTSGSSTITDTTSMTDTTGTSGTSSTSGNSSSSDTSGSSTITDTTSMTTTTGTSGTSGTSGNRGTTGTSGTSGTSVSNNLMEVLNTTPNVSRFADLLAATTLTLPLTTEGPFTVFAPSDDAIAALSSSTLQGLESDQNALVNLLQNHLVIGSISSDRLVALGSALTVQGNTLTISQQNGTLMVDGAQVIGTAIPAANGVIYIIDQVLMPANP